MAAQVKFQPATAGSGKGTSKRQLTGAILCAMVGLTAFTIVALSCRVSSAQANQDKYTLKVPGGLASSDFKGYEEWQAVGPSQTDAAKGYPPHSCEPGDDRGL
jgi:hypothetical protein